MIPRLGDDWGIYNRLANGPVLLRTDEHFDTWILGAIVNELLKDQKTRKPPSKTSPLTVTVVLPSLKKRIGICEIDSKWPATEICIIQVRTAEAAVS